MKYSIISGLLIWIFTTVVTMEVFSQKAELSADSLARREAAFLGRALSLSSLQQAKVEKVCVRQHHLRQSLSKQKMDSAARRNTLRQIQKAYFDEMKSILTPIQLKAYDEFRKSREAAYQERARRKGIKVRDVPEI